MPSTVPPTAELLADGGAAARSDDFFRSEAFLDAEGVTHTLRVSSSEVSVEIPVVVRPIPGSTLFDAISPYGYPGGTLDGPGEPPASSEVDWAESGLVSAFLRERIVREPSLAGPRERSTVLLHDPAAERFIRPGLVKEIRRNERRGWRVRILTGPSATTGDVGLFRSIYYETMRRADAAQRYFFEAEYLESILRFPRSWLLLAESVEGAVGAGAIVAMSDGVLHHYLGGTADAALSDSPFKNVAAVMMDLADEMDAPLNFGGGVHPGDGLERFKRGFSNAEAPFRTHEIVCDVAAFESLAAGRPSGGFFPAYRAP